MPSEWPYSVHGEQPEACDVCGEQLSPFVACEEQVWSEFVDPSTGERISAHGRCGVDNGLVLA